MFTFHVRTAVFRLPLRLCVAAVSVGGVHFLFLNTVLEFEIRVYTLKGTLVCVYEKVLLAVLRKT